MGIFCKICNEETKYEKNHFSRYHLKNIHNINIKEYYDLYLKKNKSEGFCVDCGNVTKFRNIKYGYSKRCKYCGQRSVEKRNKISESCIDRDYDTANKKYKQICIKKFGVENASKNNSIKIKIRNVKEKNGYIVPLNKLSDFERYKLLVLNITNKFKKELFNKWDGFDYYSGQKLISNDLFKKNNTIINKNKLQPTIDHIIPITKGFFNNIIPSVIGDVKNLCICSRYINSCKNNNDLNVFIQKGVNLMSEKNEKVDVKQIIKDLSDLKWEKDDESQMKAVQLLKGLALSKDPASNMFMKGLSDASTSIAKTILAHKSNDKNESLIEKTNNILEGMDDMEKPEIRKPNVSSTISRASELL